MTSIKKKALILEQIPYIHYLIQFKKNLNETQIQALIGSKSEVNVIYLTFVKELRLLIRPTDIGVQKIDSTMLDTYKIVIVAFLMTDKANRVKFFEKIFLVPNGSPKIVFGILVFFLSIADIDFLDLELR